jgi:hypothetical protein
MAIETGALLHIKFFQDFHERALREAGRGAYFKDAVEYRGYAARLEREPRLTLMSDQSARYEGTLQLARLGLLRDTVTWATDRGSVDREARELTLVNPIVGNQGGL